MVQVDQPEMPIRVLQEEAGGPWLGGRGFGDTRLAPFFNSDKGQGVLRKRLFPGEKERRDELS